MKKVTFITIPSLLSTRRGDDIPQDNLDFIINTDILDEVSPLLEDTLILLLFDKNDLFYSRMPNLYVSSAISAAYSGVISHLNSEGYVGEIDLFDIYKEIFTINQKHQQIPNPSSIFLAAAKYNIDLPNSIFIGNDKENEPKYAKFAKNAFIGEYFNINEIIS